MSEKDVNRFNFYVGIDPQGSEIVMQHPCEDGRYVEYADFANLCDQMDEHLKRWGECVAERDALLAANESLAKDAERYRWLRNDPPLTLAVRRRPGETERGCYMDGADLDAAIEAAIAASASAKEGES